MPQDNRTCVNCGWPGCGMQYGNADETLRWASGDSCLVDERDKDLTLLHGRLCSVCANLFWIAKKQPGLVLEQRNFISKMRVFAVVKRQLLDNGNSSECV